MCNKTELNLTTHGHKTVKVCKGDVVHYITTHRGVIVASLELKTAPCSNLWVMHSVAFESNLGYGMAIYKLAMNDIYPKHLMPSRECTSGHAVSIWNKIPKLSNIMIQNVTHPKTYCTEFDEWFEEIANENPSLTHDALDSLSHDFSFLNAIIQGKMKPHPYNAMYALKP